MHTFLSPPKEKCERPIGLQALLPRRSQRVRPRQGDLFTTKLSFSDAMQGAFRSPPRTPSGHRKKRERPLGRPVPIRAGVGASGPAKGELFTATLLPMMQAGGFPRGKQSARFALPCGPLVVCLNSGALTAFGGCAHWAPASLRSPLHPFGKSAYQGGMGMYLQIHQRAFPRGK